jgi:excisionase family DNA binding protein
MAAEVLTARQAAQFLQLSERTVKLKARTGEIPAAKVGRDWRFLSDELEEWLRAGGSRYEALVDEGLADATREAVAAGGSSVPLAEAKRRLGIR